MLNKKVCMKCHIQEANKLHKTLPKSETVGLFEFIYRANILLNKDWKTGEIECIALGSENYVHIAEDPPVSCPCRLKHLEE